MMYDVGMIAERRRRPAIELANYEAVYKYYGSDAYAVRYDGKKRLTSRFAHYVLDRLYEPRVSYGPGAQAATVEMANSKRPALILINHVSQHDPNTVSAALKKDGGLAAIIRRNGLFTIAKDSLFRGSFDRRTYFDSRNLLPAFRPKNYRGDDDKRLLLRAADELTAVSANCMLRGDSIAIFPEGTCNEVDPLRVMKIGNSAAKIALLAMAQDASDLSLVCVGINYGPEKELRNASVQLDCYAASELPSNRRDLRAFMQDGMQQAVDYAVKQY